MAGKARIYLGSHYRYDNPITICHNIVRQKLKSYLRGPFVSFAGILLKARQPQIGSHPNVPVIALSLLTYMIADQDARLEFVYIMLRIQGDATMKLSL